MRDTNNVVITGRLARDPQTRYMQNGNLTVTDFPVAINKGKKQDGTDAGADFPSVKCFGKLAENVEKYAFKGMRVLIEGHIQTGKYENKEGRTVYTTDVVAEKVEFLTYREQESIDKGKQERRDAAAVNEAINEMYSDDIPSGFEKLDDSIPF